MVENKWQKEIITTKLNRCIVVTIAGHFFGVKTAVIVIGKARLSAAKKPLLQSLQSLF